VSASDAPVAGSTSRITGAPRAELARPFCTIRSRSPSGLHAGSWWPSGSFSGTSGTVNSPLTTSKSWRTTFRCVGFGPSDITAIVLPSGDMTGWRSQWNQVCSSSDTRPFVSSSGGPLPSAGMRMSSGTSMK
jgi:hypothetical protein